MTPSGWPATWSASATMPAKSGVASLVPQVGYQPGALAGKALVGVDRAVAGCAHGDVRHAPMRRRRSLATPFW